MSEIDPAEVAERIEPYLQRPQEWVRVGCPACEAEGKDKPNLSVSLVNGFFVCWRCGGEGFVDNIDSFARADEARQIVTGSTVLPEGYRRLARDADGLAGDAYEYLVEERHCPPGAIHEAEIGVVPGHPVFGDRVLFPIRRVGGPLVGWTGRKLPWMDADPKTPKYRNSSGYNRSWLYNAPALQRRTDRPALLVEGPLDALPHWPHAVAFLGKPTSEQVDVIVHSARRPLVLVLDADAKGELAALRLDLEIGLEMLRDARRKTGVRYKVPALGEVYLPVGTDPGETPRETLSRAARRAVSRDSD